MSFLLGVAIGVMATLSVAEMYIRNAYEHGFWSVTAAMLLGIFLYYILEPCLPHFDYNEKKEQEVKTFFGLPERGTLPLAHACSSHL